MTVRKALVQDIPNIVDINTKTWRTTYSGIINERTLKRQEAFRLERIKSMEEQLKDMYIEGFKVQMVVVENKSEILGFATYGALRTDERIKRQATAEIYAIYILKELQGKGSGRQLFNYIINDLKNVDKFKDMLIWTLKDNPSRRFYEKMGGLVTYERTIEIAGQSLEEVAYLYEDILGESKKGNYY